MIHFRLSFSLGYFKINILNSKIMFHIEFVVAVISSLNATFEMWEYSSLCLISVGIPALLMRQVKNSPQIEPMWCWQVRQCHTAFSSSFRDFGCSSNGAVMFCTLSLGLFEPGIKQLPDVCLMCQSVALNIYSKCPTFRNDNRRCMIQGFLPLSLLVVSICAHHLCFGLARSVLESGHLLKHMQLCVKFLCFLFKPTRAHLHIGSKVATHMWYFYKWAQCNLATMLSGCTKITGLIPIEPTFYQSFHCA